MEPAINSRTAPARTGRRIGGISDTLIDEFDQLAADVQEPDFDDYCDGQLYPGEFASLSAWDQERSQLMACEAGT